MSPNDTSTPSVLMLNVNLLAPFFANSLSLKMRRKTRSIFSSSAAHCFAVDPGCTPPCSPTLAAAAEATPTNILRSMRECSILRFGSGYSAQVLGWSSNSSPSHACMRSVGAGSTGGRRGQLTMMC